MIIFVENTDRAPFLECCDVIWRGPQESVFNTHIG